jgi:hypothetical protein
MDKESELLKIQIYADYFHTQYNLLLSIYFGIMVTGLFFTATALFENLITIGWAMIMFLFIVFGVSLYSYHDTENYKMDMLEIFKMIEDVNEKNKVPIFKKLKKGRKNSILFI